MLDFHEKFVLDENMWAKIVFLSEKTKGEALQMSAEAFRRKSKIVKKKAKGP